MAPQRLDRELHPPFFKFNLFGLHLRIDGLFELKYPRRHHARPGTIKITIGSPIEIDRATSATEIANELEEKVASLT